MVVLNGYIKIHRKLIQWGWYSDSVVKDVFLHLLIVAAYKDSEFLGHKIKAGQAIIGYNKLAVALGFTVQQVRTAIKKLESTGEISKKSTNKFTVLTIENWADYQMLEDRATNEQQTNNKPITNEQQTNNKPITTSKEGKEIKKVKKVKKVKKEIYGEYENVLLAPAEFEKLVAEYQDYQERIDRLSGYIASKGDKYKSHYATIKNWARKDKTEAEVKPTGKTATRKSFMDIDF